MTPLRFSREEYRRIGREIAREEGARGGEVMARALRSYKSGAFGRVRVAAVPRLPTKNRVAENGSGWRYLFLARVLADATWTTLGGSSGAPLVLSTLSLLPFASKGERRGPLCLWLVESALHLTLDVLHARWASSCLSLFVMCCCLCGAPTGSSSVSSRTS